MAIFLTSDLHLGHDMVARTRGFTDSREHDDVIAARWRRTAQREAEVWVLGDIALSGWQRALELLDGLPGTKHLVVGNHDRCSPIASNGHRYHAAYREVFASISTAGSIRFAGHNLLLSHFPYDGDRGPDRHPQWRLPDLGTPLLHGHLHDAVRYRHSRHGTPMVHVGLDAWGLRPVPLADAVALLPPPVRSSQPSP